MAGEKVTRKVRIITTQHVLHDRPPIQEGFPMRKWSIQICLLDSEGQEVPATVFDKVTYKLHPTFDNPVRPVRQPPFLIEEEGWGEFEMQIVFTIAERGGEQTVNHDLNFAQERYANDISINFPTSKPGLLQTLSQSGPVPQAQAASPAVGDKRGAEAGESKPKKQKTTMKGSVDLEKLSHGLEKLNEQDILSIVQMVSDNRTPDMYVKNDAEHGEFHIDLFTVPNGLLKTMWEFVAKRVEV